MAKDQITRKVDPPLQFDFLNFYKSFADETATSSKTSCNERVQCSAVADRRQNCKKRVNNCGQLEYSAEKRPFSVNMLPEKMYKEVQEDMEDWENYMRCKEFYELTKSIAIPATDEIPPVRNVNRVNIMKFSSQKRHVSNLFSCSKIRSHEESWIEEASEKEKSLKQIHVQAEKARGNKAYQAGDYIKACEHYSNCIALAPLKEAYNNRAQANIKLKNFMSALPDLNEVLKLEPMNIKALYRRAVCRKEIRMYNEALADLKVIFQAEPDNKEAKQVYSRINKDMAELSGKKYRIRENFGNKNTFKVYEIQLAAYAHCENEYVMEVDTNGCAKSCVCGFCVKEDRAGRGRLTSLRIKEPDRWKRLTPALLEEMRISSSLPAAVSKDLEKITNVERSSIAVKLLNGNIDEERKTRTRIEKRRSESKRESSKIGANDTSLANKDLQSMKNIQNAQQSASIERMINNISLAGRNVQNGISEDIFEDILKKTPPSALSRKFESRLDEQTLTNMIKSLCNNFCLQNEWKLMSEYLIEIAALERFKIIISFIDEKVKNELCQMFDTAINMKLEKANQIKKLYF